MDIISIRQTGDEGEAVVRFSGSVPFFAGHFPQKPILPGVVLIDAAVQIAAQALQRPLRLRHLAHVKFSHVVEPDQEVAFTFKIAPDPLHPGRVRIGGKWSRGDVKIAELQFAAVQEGGGDGPQA